MESTQFFAHIDPRYIEDEPANTRNNRNSNNRNNDHENDGHEEGEVVAGEFERDPLARPEDRPEMICVS